PGVCWPSWSNGKSVSRNGLWGATYSGHFLSGNRSPAAHSEPVSQRSGRISVRCSWKLSYGPRCSDDSTHGGPTGAVWWTTFDVCWPSWSDDESVPLFGFRNTPYSISGLPSRSCRP
ncbi:unnamed protein product, partial [Scytosiphon promiscuus]